MTILRAYKVKDVEMLLASKTIMTSFTDNLGDLSTIRTDWTDRFATGLTEEIDNAMETYLGLDKKKELRSATTIVASIQAPALRDLSFLKTQIEVDFGAEAKTITDALGFGKYMNEARSGDQEALIQQLYAFNKGMDEPAENGHHPKGHQRGAYRPDTGVCQPTERSKRYAGGLKTNHQNDFGGGCCHF